MSTAHENSVTRRAGWRSRHIALLLLAGSLFPGCRQVEPPRVMTHEDVDVAMLADQSAKARAAAQRAVEQHAAEERAATQKRSADLFFDKDSLRGGAANPEGIRPEESEATDVAADRVTQLTRVELSSIDYIALDGVLTGERPVASPAKVSQPLANLDGVDAAEFLSILGKRLGAKGYRAVELISPDDDAIRWRSSDNKLPVAVFWRRTLGQSPATWLLRVGMTEYARQGRYLEIDGVVLNAGAAGPNTDIEFDEAGKPKPGSVGEIVAALATQFDTYKSSRGFVHLARKTIQLSNADAERAMHRLATLGVTTVQATARIVTPPAAGQALPSEIITSLGPTGFDARKVPYVVWLADPGKADTGIVGGGAAGVATQGGDAVPTTATQLSERSGFARMTELVVLYDKDQPEQFNEIRRLVDEFVDKPARQALIEALVIEINENGLEELGVQWSVRKRRSALAELTAGTLDAEGSADTLTIEGTDDAIQDLLTGTVDLDWRVKLRALVENGHAEVLSRPSVLTVSNRQSTIRVGENIPIATSTTNPGSDGISVTFTYQPVGILLNIRPRITEKGNHVNMMVDAVVSSVVEGGDVVVLQSNSMGEVARAPRLATRRVQTYARIPNNTPLIIGGLVQKKESTVRDKIPILGDIPLIGAAFRSERVSQERSEVIIVLTPYVLPEGNVERMLPRDHERIDTDKAKLFRSSYRLQHQDVYDLDFLYENPRLQEYNTLAQEAIAKNFKLATQYPFSEFAGEVLPGQEMLATRMLSGLLKRRDVVEKLNPENIIVVDNPLEEEGGFGTNFLERPGGLTHELSEWTVERLTDFFEQYPEKAIRITFTENPGKDAGGWNNPANWLPDFDVETAPEEIAGDLRKLKRYWREQLWDLNQTDDDGCQIWTILLRSEDDVEDLHLALALKQLVKLNGGRRLLQEQSFQVGSALLIPDIRENHYHVIDEEVARYFFHRTHYYSAAFQEIELKLMDLDKALRQPEVKDTLTPARRLK